MKEKQLKKRGKKKTETWSRSNLQFPQSINTIPTFGKETTRSGKKNGEARMWKATLSASAPALPEGCIAHVLAFTTLRNACRMPAVLSVFLLASESGVVWERFLPSDYPNILGRSLESSSQLDFSSSLDLRGQKGKMHDILQWY